LNDFIIKEEMIQNQNKPLFKSGHKEVMEVKGRAVKEEKKNNNLERIQ
jgi:hypothetical protein